MSELDDKLNSILNNPSLHGSKTASSLYYMGGAGEM